ncbi:hypothetical protein ACDW_23790 [Acidovorax sp. DW039]|uniref:hypothetical protein n=1 Tax=Acidovorax sp. DW039 TaxID=3095606 RepID=UPI0030929202|nr:hypothetical protein ACDW_23790 [Acidovorax sp. DW039]
MRLRWRTFIRIACAGAVSVMALAGAPAQAAGGTGTYALDWHRKGETLQYRSCGCADSCWVAEVKNQRTHQTLAILRCDCTRLLARVPARPGQGVGPSTPEAEQAPSCAAVNESDNKPRAIREALEQLLGR